MRRLRESERDLEIKILIFRRFLVKANSDEEASTARAEEDQKDKEAAAEREREREKRNYDILNPLILYPPQESLRT